MWIHVAYTAAFCKNFMFLNVCVKESTNTGKSCTKKPYQAYVSINFALKIIGNGKKKKLFFQ